MKLLEYTTKTINQKVSRKIFDSKTNTIIDLHHMDVFGDEIVLVVDQKFYSFFKTWVDNTFNEINGRINNYKRDIIIFNPLLNESMIRLFGCFIEQSFNFEDDGKMQVNLRYDYTEMSDNFPELKCILRDLKIDDILS